MTAPSIARPLILGLTGSIGMGKSTVAAMFADEAVPVFDADATVHRLQGPGGRVVAAIEAAFPGTTSDRGVDRAKLSAFVLGNDDAMRRLEGIVHPAVAEERAAFLAANADAPFVDRVMAMDAGQDMRHRGLPTVIEMIRSYFPVGSGLGGFDPLFRMHEPFALLKPTYFNHAHNDFLEIVLDTGLVGLLLLITAIIWWGWASVRVWRDQGDRVVLLARLGSAMILLVLLASLFDYPARTPTMMALLVVAAVWLAKGANRAAEVETADDLGFTARRHTSIAVDAR